MKNSLITLQLNYLAILLLLCVLVTFIYNYTINQQQKLYLEKTTQTYQKTYDLVYNQYKEMSNLIFTGLIQFTNAKEVFKELETLNQEEQQKVREELYNKSLPRYKTLKTKHIKSINYILSDNTMFLKMNNPKSYGMKTTKRRYSVNYTHEKKIPFDTYEIGKYGEGIRFIYPIMDQNRYLGILEITYGLEALTSTFMKQYDVWCNVQINGKNFNKELLVKKPNLYAKSVHNNYIIDKNVVRVLKNKAKLTQNNLLPSKKTIQKVYQGIQKDLLHSIYDDKFSQVFTLIPIVHKLTKEKEAVFIIRSKNEQITLINHYYYLGLFTIFLILFLIVYVLYLNHIKIIKEKKELENEKYLKQEILKSKDQLKSIFDNAQVGLMYISRERVLIKANQALADIFGYASVEEMIGLSMREFHLNENNFREYGKENFDSLKNGIKQHIEYPLRKKDGSAIWCEMSGKAIDNHIPADMSKGVLWVVNDISLRKSYQLELERQKEEFETIFNYAHDGIAIIDLNRNFLNFNKAFLRLTGLSEQRLKEENCSNLTSPSDRVKNDEAIDKAIATGDTVIIEKECTLEQDMKVSVIMSVTLLPDKQRLLLLLHDTTIAKTMQEQSKLASMGEMIGNIAHQWRQPLSVISTAATGLKIEKEYDILTDERFFISCDAINDNAQYLSKTIDDFKNFIKGDRQKEQFLLHKTIESFLNLVQGTIKSNNLELVLDIDKTLELDGYENELIQCFINIFNNAKDVMVENKVENRYIFISSHKTGNSIQIIIKDNGGGIPQDIKERVFEPYFTTKHQTQGTGLGLNMVYTLVTEGMGGLIEVENEEFVYNQTICKGASFIITLPRK